MTEKGCEIPKIECVECLNKRGENEGGNADMATNTLNICYDTRGMTEELLPKVILHEIVHAFDTCHGLEILTNCDQLICSEIRAHTFANCYDGSLWRGSRTREECAKDFSFVSVALCKACDDLGGSDKIKERIAELLETCMVDDYSDENSVPPVPPEIE